LNWGINMAKKGKSNKEAENIQLRSDEVQEILSRPPAWIVRWGTTLIVAIIALLLLGSWFFKYPDVVHSRIVVTTENPPAPIVARASGNIEHLFVSDKQKVEKDQALAVIQNTANYNHVLQLEKGLQAVPSDSVKDLVSSKITRQNYKLGQIQPVYATFLSKLEDYQHFLELNYHQQKIKSLKEELAKYEDRVERLLRQKTLNKEEFNLIKKQYIRDSALYEKQFIPEAEFEKSESKLIRKKYELEQSEISLSNARIEISKIEQDILDLQLDYRQRSNQLRTALVEARDNLESSIKQWKHDFYLASPLDGTVTFTKYWSENQSVRKGERVMTIIPRNQGEMIGKLTLNFKGAGKVKKGQEVNIKFSNYPYLEYGMVRGVVRSISMVPEDQNYIVEVALPDSLTTFYGKTLSFTQQMQGSAEIITEDKRLLEQVLRPIKYVFSRNFAASSTSPSKADTLITDQRKMGASKESLREVNSSSKQTEGKSMSDKSIDSKANPQTKEDLEIKMPQHQYYLIGGSFRNKNNAEDFREKLLKKGFDAEILHESNGLHKVSYRTCKSLNKAQAELKKLEQKGIDSWIYQPPANK